MAKTKVSKVYLRRQVSHLTERQHPWLFSGAIGKVEGAPLDGEVVGVYAADNSFYAWGLYNSNSQIRVRLYSWQEGEYLESSFWQQRLQEAIKLRQKLLVNDEIDAYRLVNSEGDHLSGLTVDRYGEYLVFQFTSLALYERKDLIIETLKEILNPKGIYLRTDKGIGESEKLVLSDGLYWGAEPEDPLIINENGIKYYISLQTGQKTGFYLDQRENRKAISKYVQGRTILDMFCYTGGFSITAAVNGAREVIGIDISEPALKLAQKNRELNRLENKIEFEKEESFRKLTAFIEKGKRFDLIILDPPKFTKSKGAVSSAIKGYISLNELAIRCLNPSGILVTCSCSGRISVEQFAEIIRIAALRNNRLVRLLEKRGAAPDHPVNLQSPESEYLKCFICHLQ